MSRATMAATLFLCLTLTAGCSDSELVTAPSSAPSATESAAIESTSEVSALEGLSALQIWRKTKKDAKQAKSVHLTGSFIEDNDRIQIDLKLNDTNRGIGTISLNGEKIFVRRLGKVLYFKANRKFWDSVDPAATNLFGNRWLKTKNQSGDMAEFFQLVDMDSFISDSLKLSAADRKKLKRGAGTPVAGQETVALKSAAKAFGVLYVAANGPTLPLDLVLPADKRQFMKFRGWNDPVTVTAPKSPIDMDKLS
ncbi:MAG TPA: hypothetical protein VLL08_25570 [Kineosporiaceae bacterium]|nr:hypothetical protein [Kineosporiaceae bacterium]